MQNSEIFKLYNEYDVVKFIELGTLTWAGHVMRIEESDPAKKVLCNKPNGSGARRRGRQELRRCNELEEDAVGFGAEIGELMHSPDGRG